MVVRFWGVRGSLPTPLKADQVQAKIAAAVSRISPKDIADSESRMKFLSSLPDWIYGTAGGNTPCVEVRSSSGQLFLLDCGTGLREFSSCGQQPDDGHYIIFLSHFHWDHIQGFPFFSQAFDPSSRIDIYSPFAEADQYLERQSSLPFFPLNGCYQAVKNQLSFHLFCEGDELELSGTKIRCRRMTHPGDSYSYSFEEAGKKFIYCTDAELQSADFYKDDPKNEYFKGADAIALDSQYTDPEASIKVNWGHSSFSTAVDFALAWDIKKLYFFHYEPSYDDKKLDSILQSAEAVQKSRGQNSVKIYISKEGQEIQL